MITPSERICDDCGKAVAKIHRNVGGYRYCATCYARVFKRRICPACGHLARLPRHDPKAVCRACTAAKPCIRCGKSGYRTGKLTQYGPVCNACSPHFREPEPCEACGTPSPRLTRVTRFGHDKRLCPRCAVADHGTCSACRRHRRLQEGADGRRLCATCLNEGEIPCPGCGEARPAGRRSLCERCYWTRTTHRRIEIDACAFSSPAMAAAFREFGQWLINAVGPHKAAQTIHRYLQFFLDINDRWPACANYQALLELFGAEGLRRARLPMRWLKETHGIVADATLRQADSARRGSAAIIASLPEGSTGSKALVAFANTLEARHAQGKTSLHSIRLALSPAASLLRRCDKDGRKLPSQTELDAFLAASPGQLAAITGFVNFLNRAFGGELVPRIDELQVEKMRRSALEGKLMDLLQEDLRPDDVLKRWIPCAMEYFHNVPVRTLKTLRDRDVTRDESGAVVTLNGIKYWVPLGTATYPEAEFISNTRYNGRACTS